MQNRTMIRAREQDKKTAMNLALCGREAERMCFELADRLRRLSPSPRNPLRFHEEKSELEHELRQLGRALR